MRFIREYVIERQLLTLEETIRKMTSLPADSAKLSNRGRLKQNLAADIVVFDLDKVFDNSTDSQPQAYPSGIDLVVVNGIPVLENGIHTKRCTKNSSTVCP